MFLPKQPHESTKVSVSHLTAWALRNIEVEDKCEGAILVCNT